MSIYTKVFYYKLLICKGKDINAGYGINFFLQRGCIVHATIRDPG